MSAFAKLDAEAPGYPNETCPDINRVQETVDKATKAIEDCRNTLEEHSNALDNLTGRRGELEDLRTQNSELRESAIYWRDVCKTLSDTVEEQSARIEQLEHMPMLHLQPGDINGPR